MAGQNVIAERSFPTGGSRPGIPGLRMLRTYQRRWLGSDLLTGATVFAVLVPSALAYGALAGLEPVTGLYAALAAMIAYALFGSSRQLMIGPDAALPLIMVAAIGPLAGGDPARYIALTAGLTVIVGIFCIIAGFLRVGFLVNLLAQPILSGYLAGVALTVIASQFGRMLGLKFASDTFFAQLWEAIHRFNEAHWLTLGIGLVGLVTLFSLKRIAPRVPGPLIVMVVSTVLVGWLHLDQSGLKVIGTIPAGLPQPVLPLLSLADLRLLLLPGATIALISFADEIVTARSFAAKNRYQIDADQELVGLGVADVACGLVGGFPVSSSSARTAVVDVMGGKTQVVGLVASAFLILFLFFFTGLLAHLPLVVLATVLIVAVSGLVDVAEFRRLYTIRRSEFILAIVTMFAVLTLGLLEALGIAITLALVAALSRLVRPNDAVLVPNASGEGFHEIELKQTRDHAMVSGVIVYRFDGPLFFANAPRFLQRVRTLVAASDPAPEWLLIDAEAIVDLDTTAASMLSDLVEELRGRGIQVGVARASAPLRRMFQKTGLMEQIGSDCLFPMVSAAVRDCSASRQVTRQDGEALRVQTAVSHGTGIA